MLLLVKAFSSRPSCQDIDVLNVEEEKRNSVTIDICKVPKYWETSGEALRVDQSGDSMQPVVRLEWRRLIPQHVDEQSLLKGARRQLIRIGLV